MCKDKSNKIQHLVYKFQNIVYDDFTIETTLILKMFLDYIFYNLPEYTWQSL